MLNLRRMVFIWVNNKIFYGWVILAVACFTMIGTGPGQSHLVGLYFDSISSEMTFSFGPSWLLDNRQTAIAFAYGIATFFAAFFLPQMGRIVDRYGPMVMLCAVLVCLSATALMFMFVTDWLTIALVFGLLRFLGQGSIMLACVNLVSQWFDRRRGFALGIMSLGFPLSMALHPPICQWMIDDIGWRSSWLWLSISTLILFLPFVILFIHNRPEQLGLRPDGDICQKTSLNVEVWGLTRKEAVRSPAFYIIASGLFSLSMLVTTLHVFFKSILTEHGIEPQTATMMFTVSGITAAVSMPIVGHMLDKFPTERMFCGGLIVMVASLVSVTYVDGLFSAVVFALIFGLNNGVTMTFFGFMWPKYFGRRHLGSIQGLGQMVGIVGASLGAIPLAIAIDQFGEYDIALRSMALFPLFCACLALFLRMPVKDTTNLAK